MRLCAGTEPFPALEKYVDNNESQSVLRRFHPVKGHEGP